MALTVEDGTGVPGADSYFAVATADAYWTARPQDPNAAIWAAAPTLNKEGAAREATDYLDANWGSMFPGARRTMTQGRLWPRVDRSLTALSECHPTVTALEAAQALTDRPLLGSDGLELAGLPAQIVQAAIELGVRAVIAPLAADTSSLGWIKREKVGSLETEYGSSGPVDGSYGYVDRILGPLVGGVVRGQPTWLWT